MIGVLALLIVVAGAALVATKPSESELRAAALAKRDTYFRTEYQNGKPVLTLVDERGNSIAWMPPGGPDVWQYRDSFFWSELVVKFKDGKELVVARGRAGNIWVTD